MEVKTPQTDDEFARYFELRWRVLRGPWGGAPGSERDELEDSAAHAMITAEDGRVLAVGRLHLNSPEEAQIRYMAVAEDARGQGLGRRIVEHLEGIARARNARVMILNARDEVTGFYSKLGYERIGAGPTLFGTIAHSRMQKRL